MSPLRSLRRRRNPAPGLRHGRFRCRVSPLEGPKSVTLWGHIGAKSPPPGAARSHFRLHGTCQPWGPSGRYQVQGAQTWDSLRPFATRPNWTNSRRGRPGEPESKIQERSKPKRQHVKGDRKWVLLDTKESLSSDLPTDVVASVCCRREKNPQWRQRCNDLRYASSRICKRHRSNYNDLSKSRCNKQDED